MPLRVSNLSFAYGDNQVLKGLDAAFEAGKLSVILGPNGSGKSTLLNCMTSNLDNYQGEIILNGKEIKKYGGRERAKKLSYVPQNTIIDFEFTCFEIVLMGRSPYLGLLQNESFEDREIARRAMEETQVFHLKDKSINEISGGERQRVLIARALCQEADVMLLDEPAANLDIYHEIRIMQSLKDLTRERDRTIITVMHDLNTACTYADCLYLLHEGKIYAKGKAKDVLTSEKLREVYQVDSEFIEYGDKSHLFIKDTI